MWLFTVVNIVINTPFTRLCRMQFFFLIAFFAMHVTRLKIMRCELKLALSFDNRLMITETQTSVCHTFGLFSFGCSAATRLFALHMTIMSSCKRDKNKTLKNSTTNRIFKWVFFFALFTLHIAISICFRLVSVEWSGVWFNFWSKNRIKWICVEYNTKTIHTTLFLDDDDEYWISHTDYSSLNRCSFFWCFKFVCCEKIKMVFDDFKWLSNQNESVCVNACKIIKNQHQTKCAQFGLLMDQFSSVKRAQIYQPMKMI